MINEMIVDRFEGSVDENNRVLAYFLVVIFEVHRGGKLHLLLGSFWKRMLGSLAGVWKYIFPCIWGCFGGGKKRDLKVHFRWIYPICVPQR